MKRLYSYLAAIPLVFLSLAPPVNFGISITNSKLWLWLFVLAGFLGLFSWFMKINIFIKLFLAFAFINCFFSFVPFISFSAYTLLIACFYYYVICLRVRQWDIFYKSLLIILLLNSLLLFLQFIHKDSLLNFGLKFNTCYGVIGNWMQLKSFFIIAAAFLIALKKPVFLKKNFWAVFIACFLLSLIYLLNHKVIPSFLYARGPVWLKTIQLSQKHYWFGYGIGTFKILFPALGNMVCPSEGTWLSAHNDWLQIFFEGGAVMIFVVITFVINLACKLWKGGMFYCLLGLLIVCADMAVHFSLRENACVLVIIPFLSFCQKELSDG